MIISSRLEILLLFVIGFSVAQYADISHPPSIGNWNTAMEYRNWNSSYVTCAIQFARCMGCTWESELNYTQRAIYGIPPHSSHIRGSLVECTFELAKCIKSEKEAANAYSKDTPQNSTNHDVTFSGYVTCAVAFLRCMGCKVSNWCHVESVLNYRENGIPGVTPDSGFTVVRGSILMCAYELAKCMAFQEIVQHQRTGIAAPCRPDFEPVPGLGCVKLIENYASWFNARSACFDIGADLVFLDSDYDDVSAIAYYLASKYVGDYHFWVGLHQNKPPNWEWVKGGQITYFSPAWDRHYQPDDGSYHKECAIIYSGHGHLEPKWCSDNYKYICKMRDR